MKDATRHVERKQQVLLEELGATREEPEVVGAENRERDHEAAMPDRKATQDTSDGYEGSLVQA